jgi:hypothetical protein
MENAEGYEGGQLELVDLQRKTLRTLSVPSTVLEEPGRSSWNGNPTLAPAKVIGAMPGLGGTVVTADQSGAVHVFEVDPTALEGSLKVWRAMVGASGSGRGSPLSVEFSNVTGRSEFERRVEPCHIFEFRVQVPHALF